MIKNYLKKFKRTLASCSVVTVDILLSGSCDLFALGKKSQAGGGRIPRGAVTCDPSLADRVGYTGSLSPVARWNDVVTNCGVVERRQGGGEK